MRVTKILTIAAGTPINVATGSSTVAAGIADRLMATRIVIQMQHGGSGIGYVIPEVQWGRLPTTNTAPDIPIEMSAATATGPGGSYSDSDFREGGGIDVSRIWIDGGNTGDKVIVSYDVKV